jgi:oxygen-independent coproporphyrinogen-3 oxidase
MESCLGVYVHIPFCTHICPYCDFAVEAAGRSSGAGSSDWRATEEGYVTGLLAELALRAPTFAGRSLASLYFGGGTPSLLRPDSLARIREAVEAAFPGGSQGVEVTLEVNPSSVEREHLPGFREEAGVNRLSLGVQSFNDSLLKALGRAHKADACRRTLEAARAAGFGNLSLDLMFAALHQTPAMLEADLDEALGFGPEHLSCYELVFEGATPFGRAASAGRLNAYPEDASADMIERIEERLGASGYRRYELTNYARPGYEAVHNRRYWQRRPVLGLGVGAHSTDPPGPGRPHGARHANPRDRRAWLDAVAQGIWPLGEEEVLERGAAMAESCFLALRCDEGLDERAFEAEFGESPRERFGPAIGELLAKGLLETPGEGRLALSRQGRLLADTVCAEFV